MTDPSYADTADDGLLFSRSLKLQIRAVFFTSCELQIAQIVDLVDRLVSLSFSPSVSRSDSVDIGR